ncbi:phytanoyl-CoA dioxygenase family protein [Saccharothrix sp. Mg75]|uniref:phytanoyl-CoA dioxygenase family protein n=1 Tax=Saccharothrix sp. Mg75 TaxID=3445357 RepID=UPI003EED079E
MTVSHFRTFGFVVLRGLLSPEEAERLRVEAEAAVDDAYGGEASNDDLAVADAPAFDVPTMSDRTPFAAGLVADDPRFWQASQYLMGRATVPTNGEVTCFRANARWHADMTSEVQGVKFMAYLEPCTPDSGQMQVLPGSHRAAAGPEFADYLRQDPCRQGFPADLDDWPVPAYGIDTEPGDVIAFHSNLLHSSVGGRRRMAWDVYYFADPALEGAQRSEEIRDAILHIGDYGGHPLDHEKWSVWRDWLVGVKTSTARSTAANRLKRLGVLDVEGAAIGTPEWQPRLTKPATVWVSGAPPRRRARR